MKNISLTLFLEINELNYIFYVGESNENNDFKILYELEVPLKGIENNKISDLEKVYNTVKENLYFIEHKFNYTFKELVIILENFNSTFINLTGFKKLNGSQVLRENIIYILNTLKSYVNEIEPKKTILHIFNSKFYLDNKKIENLPIGLFGDFYSHELSLILINTNDYNNLKNIFDKCNLKIKKLLVKSFIKGVYISDNYKNSDTFFQVKIGDNSSKVFFFENNTLKLEQKFKFGTDIIIKDISKVTSLDINTIKMILKKIEFKEKISENDIIEKIYFKTNNYRKVKKRLIYEIAFARIREISELMIFKNVNFRHYNKISKNIYLEIDQRIQFKCLVEIFRTIFSINGKLNLNFTDDLLGGKMLSSANKLVHFGWKKEAIPVSHSQKSLIARVFDKIFG